MQQNKINILSTRPLSKELIHAAAEKNIFIESISFIETEMIVDENLKEKIKNLSHHSLNIVFTSMNAVEAVTKYLNGIKPNWKIFCIGNTTKKLTEENFAKNSIARTADSASALANVIISEKNISSVVFFCGNQRRDELPEKLLHHNIEVKEMVVYKTIPSSHQITKDYDGIIFYSPSAVNSFFSVNKINQRTILFAIGNTTATEMKKFVPNKIIIANEPSKKLLAEQAINYFEIQPTHN